MSDRTLAILERLERVIPCERGVTALRGCRVTRVYNEEGLAQLDPEQGIVLDVAVGDTAELGLWTLLVMRDDGELREWVAFQCRVM